MAGSASVTGAMRDCLDGGRADAWENGFRCETSDVGSSRRGLRCRGGVSCRHRGELHHHSDYQPSWECRLHHRDGSRTNNDNAATDNGDDAATDDGDDAATDNGDDPPTLRTVCDRAAFPRVRH